MDTTTLVDEDITAGERLLRELDEASFPVTAALWWFLPDPGVWRLIIATPEVDNEGPKAGYGRVWHTLRDRTENIDLLRRIALTSPNDDMITLLGTALRTDPTSISRIRFTGNTINGVFISDALIYRLA